MIMIFHTTNPEETANLGSKLAAQLKKGDIVGFIGDLGSGKTTMIKGIVKHLAGINAYSPSFIIVNEYPGTIPVFHFDLYRLKGKIEQELYTLGWDEYFNKGILLIEWADKIKNILPGETIFINFQIATPGDKRTIEIKNLRGTTKRSFLSSLESTENRS